MLVDFSKISYSQMIRGALGNRCPRCFEGDVFRGIVAMNKSCPHCGFVYERENGYFLGALVVSYLMGCFSVVPTLVISIFVAQASLTGAIVAACSQVLLLTPILLRYSRLFWLHWDYRADPHDRPR